MMSKTSLQKAALTEGDLKWLLLKLSCNDVEDIVTYSTAIPKYSCMIPGYYDSLYSVGSVGEMPGKSRIFTI